MNPNTALTIQQPQEANQLAAPMLGINFFDLKQFEHAQRVANMFAQSPLVPREYQGNIGNCVLALDIASRTQSSPLMVMQNLYMIHGKPSWSSQYIIAAINASGRYTSLRFDVVDKGPIELKGVKTNNRECTAFAWERHVAPGQQTKANRLESAPISVATAISEGWWSKNGSKWPIMTELMLRYRAATLFGRMYAPELLMGMRASEEAADEVIEVTATTEAPAPAPARRRRGVTAAALEDAETSVEIDAATPPAPVTTTAETKAPAPAPTPEPTPAPAPAPEPAPTTTAAPAQAADPAHETVDDEAPSTPPTLPPLAAGEKEVEADVDEVVSVNHAGKVASKILLGGGVGTVFFLMPPADFVTVGKRVIARIYQRESTKNPGQFIPVISNFVVKS